MTIPREVGAELEDRLASDVADDPDRIPWSGAAWPRLTGFGARLRRELLLGSGVVRVGGLADLNLSEPRRRTAFSLVGRAIGAPMLQYGLLYEVRDRGKSYREEPVPVSMTGSATGFHTDSSARDTLPDFVGLLCEEPSRAGGDSLVSNALRVHELLRHRDPAALAALYQPLVRDVVTPGVAKTHANLLRNEIPVFAPSRRPEGVVFRYMRYWIERGQERAGAPLGARQIEALDRLDALLGDPEQVVRFRLETGGMLWVNNRTVAHNRDDYRDTPGNVRRLQRMWVAARACESAREFALPAEISTA